jgi:hypothetical protein
MAVKPKVRVLVKQVYPPAQLAVLTKARQFGWSRSLSNVVNPAHPGQVAVVLTLQGTTAIVYPDGTMDRQSAQKDGRLYYRTGWTDPVAIATAKEVADRRAEKALRILKEEADEYVLSHNIISQL